MTTEQTTQEQEVTTPTVETIETEQVLEVEKKTPTTKKSKTTKAEGTVNATGELTSVVTTQGSGVGRIDSNKPLKVGIFKLSEHTTVPAYGTQDSACFDIRVNLQGELDAGNKTIAVFTKHNQPIERRIDVDTDGRPYVEIRPYERLIAPTGAIFDIPQGYSLKVHPRSGTSLKQGINLINQEAVIDADYVDELKLLLVNSSEAYARIYHNERYAQGELQEVIQNEFVELTEAPAQKTDRAGGLGHTGKN